MCEEGTGNVFFRAQACVISHQNYGVLLVKLAAGDGCLQLSDKILSLYFGMNNT